MVKARAQDEAMDDKRRLQRLLFRIVCPFVVDEGAQLIREHHGRFVQGLVCMAVEQATRWPQVGDDGARTISIRAIAQSLKLPYESARRHGLELEKAGLCVRAGDGAIAAVRGAIVDEAERRSARESFARVVAAIGALKGLGYDMEDFLHGAPAGELSGEALAIAASPLIDVFLLRAIEQGAEPHGGLIDALVFVTLMHLNAEAITYDAELAWRYSGADTPPPDAVRRPVSAAAVARRLGIPHETVRRRLAGFVEQGWATRDHRGILLSVERLQAPAILNTGLVLSQRFGQLVQMIHRLGFDVRKA